jgi:hypothetical protein
VNHIEIRYEIVEGGQNGSGVWPDTGSIRFRAGELTPQDHNVSLRFQEFFFTWL